MDHGDDIDACVFYHVEDTVRELFEQNLACIAVKDLTRKRVRLDAVQRLVQRLSRAVSI